MSDATSAAHTGGAPSLFGASADATTRDGRRQHYASAGTAVPGTPTVVFEAGMGSSRAVWALVQPAVAVRTRAVVYDRSGHGRSERDQQPRTLARVAGDLLDLLRAIAGGPFVLVGHMRPLVRALPAEAAAGVLTEDASLAGAHTFQAELRPFTGDMRALRDAPLPAPQVPLTVVSGARRPRVGASLRAALVAAHERRASSAVLGRHVRAARSTHYVMLSEPELVVREILHVVDQVAASRAPARAPAPRSEAAAR